MPLTTTAVELQIRHTQSTSSFQHSDGIRLGSQNEVNPVPNDERAAPENAASVVPDGGYGWVVVFCCSLQAFWFSGLTGSWGVIQSALLSSTLKGTPSSTTAFVASLSITICVAFGLVAVRVMQLIGVPRAGTLGVLLLGIGAIASGSTTKNVAGLFQTYGVILGIGDCLLYTITNVMPPQYFARRLGLANALIKLGGGLGATILSLAANSLITRVGVPWTFRILGLLILLTGLPAALATRERTPHSTTTPLLDLALFTSLPFTAIFIAGATATFTLFIPPFFLPLFAQSIGLSTSSGAGLVAGFNVCTTVGRFLAGPLCDRIGPLNTFVIVAVTNALSILAVWPVSSATGPLILFVVLNGVANGAFFTTLPTVVASMVDSTRAGVAMSMSITGWTGGYLVGTPIAGYLIAAGGGAVEGGEMRGPAVYRDAIFYAGGLASLSSVFVVVARMATDRKVIKRL